MDGMDKRNGGWAASPTTHLDVCTLLRAAELLQDDKEPEVCVDAHEAEAEDDDNKGKEGDPTC